jgi:hypothetical protein
MKMMATRNAEGIVTMNGATAKIPTNRSMLGMVGMNGFINGGVYKEDGLVYLNGKPVRKWHITVGDYRLWEPKLNDLPSLYRLYKKTQAANHLQWGRIAKVMDELWALRKSKKDTYVIAHAIPTHHFEWNKDSKPWWEYTVEKATPYEGLGFHFQWVDEKPKKVVNHKLGQRLYEEERRWYDTSCKRAYKVRSVFYEAMKRSLPKATEHKVISLQFDEDTFWFYTASKGPHCHWWEMFDDQYKFEIKRIV